MKLREEDMRSVASYQEYPGSCVWLEYQYLCPECNEWSTGSDVTQTNKDGTESMLCEACAEQVFPKTLPFPAKQESEAHG